MSCVAEYSRLEEKVVELRERGSTYEKVRYLEQMDRLWAAMTPEERQALERPQNGS